MIPLGGRVFIPQPFKRLEFSVGGGTAYLHYSETASSGNTGYGYGGSAVAIRVLHAADGAATDWPTLVTIFDSNRIFHVGTTVQYIDATTNGPAVGNVPALKTSDHWTNVSFEFGFSF